MTFWIPAYTGMTTTLFDRVFPQSPRLRDSKLQAQVVSRALRKTFSS